MFKNRYKRPGCPSCPYSNKGQILEWRVSYDLVGVPNKANNIRGNIATDCAGYSIKSAKASLIKDDCATQYIMAFDDCYYTMRKDEWQNFVANFGYTDYDSRTKLPKTRLLGESRKMRKYLENGCKW